MKQWMWEWGQEDKRRKQNEHLEVSFPNLTDKKAEAEPTYTSKIAEAEFKPRANNSKIIPFSQHLILPLGSLISGKVECA